MQAGPPTPPESISGLVERVTFFNEENGFAVLKVKVRGQREEVTVVGSLPSVNAGEWLTAEGSWVRDREFGLQFRASLISSTAPTTKQGIEKYLGSGLVKGIGPVNAKRLVAQFGEKIFDIIENYSARLEEVEGIGPKRRWVIKQAWAEQKVVREIMVFLHSNGVSTSRAVRIYKRYGPEAIQTIQKDPYTLSRDISGIGFKTADVVAQKMGVPHDSVLRASAGLEHVLGEATGQGHCALPLGVMMEQAEKLLGVGQSIIEGALHRAELERFVVRESIAGEEFVFLPALRRAEQLIAERVAAMVKQQANYPAIDVPKATDWCEEKTGKKLAPSQRDALALCLRSRLVVMTGGPGVGKTTLLNALIKILRAKKVRCLLCAPTGRAAKRLGEATGLEAKTIHRLLEVDARNGSFTRIESNPLLCDTLVVDEASMVDVPLMSSLLRALPGNAALVLVGDVDQLPSVGPGMVLRNLLDSGCVPVARLTEVFRQAANSRIITNAHLINQGQFPELPDRQAETDFFFVERDEPGRIGETLVDMVKRRIPAKFKLDAIEDTQVLSPMNRGSLGVWELNSRLQEALNPACPGMPVVEKFGVQFRPGDKVIQTENNYDKEVFNGDIGRVSEIDATEKQVKIIFENREVVYDFGDLDELSLAYAITIHKSQGSEFPAVVIPVATQHYVLLQRNLIYTAVTRGKKLVVLVGQQKALGIALRNNRTEQRFTALSARLARAMGSV